MSEVYCTNFMLATRYVQMISFTLNDESDYKVRVETGDDFSTVGVEMIYAFRKAQPVDFAKHFSHLYYDGPSLKSKTPPDVFRITDGFVVISEQFRDILTAFNLGKTLFSEIPVYQFDQKTPVPGRYYFLNILEEKQAAVPEQSKNVRRIGSPENFVWLPNAGDEFDIAVVPTAREGADLWLDTTLSKLVFMTEPLARACIDEKIKPIKVFPCRLIDQDGRRSMC